VSNSHATPVGGIIGGVIGSVILVITILLLSIFIRRYRKRTRSLAPDVATPFVSASIVREVGSDAHPVTSKSRPDIRSNTTASYGQPVRKPLVGGPQARDLPASDPPPPQAAVEPPVLGPPIVARQMVHEDSGRRFHQEDSEEIEEIPPTYSPD
jgi:hypothetical protein